MVVEKFLFLFPLSTHIIILNNPSKVDIGNKNKHLQQIILHPSIPIKLLTIIEQITIFQYNLNTIFHKLVSRFQDLINLEIRNPNNF